MVLNNLPKNFHGLPKSYTVGTQECPEFKKKHCGIQVHPATKHQIPLNLPENKTPGDRKFTTNILNLGFWELFHQLIVKSVAES